MNADVLIKLQIDHNAWAIARIIRTARALPAAGLEQDFGIGPGPLRETIAHMIGAMFIFAANFDGGTMALPAEFETRSRTLDGLTSLLDEASVRLSRAMLPFVQKADATTQVRWPTAARGTLPAFFAIAQVFDHGAHHRAQCKHMLKKLGVTALPDLDPLSFGSEQEHV
ncbi:MAG: DinB family protein [Phycisphaerales bacterium]